MPQNSKGEFEMIRGSCFHSLLPCVSLLSLGFLLPATVSATAIEASENTATNRHFLSESELREMIEKLEASPDVAPPECEKTFVDGEFSDYRFVCSKCGGSTHYWGGCSVTDDHIETFRRQVEVVRSLGCDARLDDAMLCMSCHPERFLLERRPIAARLKRGVQTIPLHTGLMRYVPKEMEVQIRSFSVCHDGAYYGIKADTPYSIVERTLVGNNGRIVSDVFAPSFIPVVDGRILEPAGRTDQMTGRRIAEYEVFRNWRKGSFVITEDISRDSHLVDTNDCCRRYCLVMNPVMRTGTYWGCTVWPSHLKDIRYGTGVVAPFGPVFLSVNGGAKRRVNGLDMKVLISFLKCDPFVQDDENHYSTTKSHVGRLRSLVLPDEESRRQSTEELSQPSITYHRTEKNLAEEFKKSFRDAIEMGFADRMDFKGMSNFVSKVSVPENDFIFGCIRQQMMRKIEVMSLASDLLRSVGSGYSFTNATLSGYRVLDVSERGLLVQRDDLGKKCTLMWPFVFRDHLDCARELFWNCLWRSRNVRRGPFRRKVLVYLGFAALCKYMPGHVPAPLFTYEQDVWKAYEECGGHSYRKEVVGMFPEVKLPGGRDGKPIESWIVRCAALLDDTRNVEYLNNPDWR